MRGIVDRIGGSAAYSFKADGGALDKKALPVANHEVAVRLVIDWLGRRCILLPYAQISLCLLGWARRRGTGGDFQWRYRRERAAGAAADFQRHGECGISLDDAENERVIGRDGRISAAQSKIDVFVIHTDKEAVIAD